ncbi:IclR family transcriptional regulator [Noviherbaspirillum denitrificans]|uniref:IclR family transcriptional regulator n=1 Tax=Noviherbaspirillum denitrificans TaxID=1968433 RepID=A0A254TEF6_9BURK|nr:IclR family transcriptional regulator [Noviherbaspirillum denitrificans]OWW20915.1 IclR family transcriptional regulator [Noviherbaspirillum denitrificans]
MSNYGVAAVEKALGLLDCFKLGAESHTQADLAQLSGMHKTTVFRLLNSLERMNYVVRAADGRYYLGPQLLYLGKVYEQSFHLGRIVQPVLDKLAADTGESASYYVLHDNQRLCLFRAEVSQVLRDTTLPGTRRPLDKSAIGTVIRLWGLNEIQETAAPALPLFSSGVRDQHMGSIAAPVFGNGRQFYGALTLSGPASRLEVMDKKKVGAVLLENALALSRNLGADLEYCRSVYGS